MNSPDEIVELLCPVCGYDLRGIDSPRCPECGWEIDRTQAARSQLPWTYRGKDLSRWSAYWRTAWLATAHAHRLSREAARPVDETDARRFATITGLVAGIPFALVLVGAMIWAGGTNFLNPIPTVSMNGLSTLIPHYLDVIGPYAAGVTRWAVLPSGIVLCAWLISRAGSGWFRIGGGAGEDPIRAREQLSRAAALSYYATAPLAYLPIALALGLAGFFISTTDPAGGTTAWLALWGALIGSWIAAAGCLVLMWFNTLLMLQRSLRASGWRILLTATGLPITWAICLAIGLLAWPWVAGFVYLVIDSLRA